MMIIEHTLKNGLRIEIVSRSRASVRGLPAYWARGEGEERQFLLCDYNQEFPAAAQALSLHYEPPVIRETYKQTPQGQPEAGTVLMPGMEIVSHFGDGYTSRGIITSVHRVLTPVCQMRYSWLGTTEDAWARLEHKCDCPNVVTWSVTVESPGGGEGYMNDIILVDGKLLNARADGNYYEVDLPSTKKPVQFGFTLW